VQLPSVSRTGVTDEMVSMFDALRHSSDLKTMQRSSSSKLPSAAEIARLKANAKAVKDKGKDHWKRGTQRGTQIYGQMKAKFQGRLGQLGTSSGSIGRALSSSTSSLHGEDAMDVTPVMGQEDPKVTCLCDLGLSKAVAELALKQTEGSSINDALDWVYNPANSAMVEKTAATAPVTSAPLALPAPVPEATAAQVEEPPARMLMGSPEESTLATTPRKSGPRVSLSGRAPRVSNDGFGLGMGMGSGRGSRGRVSFDRRSNLSPRVTPLKLSSSPQQSGDPDEHQVLYSSRGTPFKVRADTVLYSARGSAYRVRADSVESLEAPEDTSSSSHSQDDDDAKWSCESAEGRAESGEEEEQVEHEEEEKSEDDHHEQGSPDDSPRRSMQPQEEGSEAGESRHAADGDDILLPPDSVSWDWPLSRTEKKIRLQLIEQRMHWIDRRTLLQELASTRGELRRRSGNCSSRMSG